MEALLDGVDGMENFVDKSIGSAFDLAYGRILEYQR
jgi:hypothetical protein